jgi:hypothetical protein
MSLIGAANEISTKNGIDSYFTTDGHFLTKAAGASARGEE